MISNVSDIPLREVRGRAHGDCSRCEIYQKFQRGGQNDQDVDDCAHCYWSGRTIDFPRVVRYLMGCIADEREVSLPDGRVVTVEEALEEAYATPGFRLELNFRLAG